MTAKHYKANYTLNSYVNLWLGLWIAKEHSSQFTHIPSHSPLTENFNYVIL